MENVRLRRFVPICAVLTAALELRAETLAEFIRAHYTKYEFNIPMRDGVKLFTQVFVPKDAGKQYPFLLNRTPYAVGPYGVDNYPATLGPSEKFAREGYIFVRQDVRGRYLSEGNFVEMTPALDHPKGTKETDESPDTSDTLDWLL